LTPPGEKIRVVVCDDHELFRRGVTEMLSFAGDVEVVGEAATHDEAVAVVSEHGPDVVLLDLEMPGGVMGADESMGRMLGLSPPPRVVVFTMHDEPGMVRRFLGRGASAYFPKSAEMGELVRAVRDAARVDPGPPAGGADAVHAPGDPPEATLGRREGR
jgi:DNA-binding NarL/FixJ family response regulator